MGVQHSGISTSRPRVFDLKNVYTAEFFAKCPNNAARVKYTLTIEVPTMLMVEKINDALMRDEFREGFHEQMADRLAQLLPGHQTMRAFHHGVSIETIREGQPC